MTQGQYGQFFGDKGYISAAPAQDLRKSNIILVTKFKKRMKNKLMTILDKQLLRKRAIVESVIEQLKHISQIEHSRHRSPQTAKLSVRKANALPVSAARMCRPPPPSGGWQCYALRETMGRAASQPVVGDDELG